VLTETTADLAFALLLAVARRVVEGDASVRDGDWLTWEPGAFLGEEVHGATLGIVGLGRIGSAVALRAEGFGMRVLGSRRGGGTPLDELLAESDFVSLHVPLSDATRGLIGARELRRMKPTAVLVNTARGEIVDTAALLRALREGWIAGAGLDVLPEEPIASDDPLLGLDNVVLTPHVAFYSEESLADLRRRTAQSVVDVLANRAPEHLANGDALARLAASR
jgi:glyoxylate reductase